MKNNKKVLMVVKVFPPRHSGAALQALKLSDHLVSRNIDVDFFVGNYSSKKIYTKSKEKKITIYKSNPNTYIFIIIFTIFLIFKSNYYQYVHFHGVFRGHFLFVLLSKLFKKTVIQKITKGDSNELNTKGKFSFYKKLALSKIDKFIAISSHLYNKCINQGISENKVFKIYNGVIIPDLKKVKFYRSEFMDKYKINSKLLMITSVSVIQERKNILDLVEVMNIVFGKRNDLKNKILICFAGEIIDKKYHIQINKYLKNNEISDNFLFLGNISNDEVYILNSLSSLFVFAGLNEGLTNSLIEAKSMGLPIIAFDTTGVKDIVVHNEDGFLVKYPEHEVFSERILYLIDNEDIYRKFSENAQSDVKKRFDFKNIANKYFDLIYN